MVESQAKPNVLLVIVDEWRAQSFGYAGDTNAHTPVVDDFSAQSVNYVQAISGTPVCCPARASFVTGQYPGDHGVYVNDVPLEPTGPTLAEEFSDSGYSTGYIGKWHLMGSPDGWFGDRSAFVPPAKRFGFQYWKAGECSHDYWNSVYYDNANEQPKVWPGYDAFSQTDDAIGFMKASAESETPFFLTVSYGPPHFPLETAPSQYQEMFAEKEIEIRPNVPAEHRAQAIADLKGYYAHMAAIDECFGRLLSTLDDTGLSSDTIVVFTSDHGDMMWSQGLEYKLLPWEESIAVPLLVRAPGHSPAVSNALFNSPDLMPTLLKLAGLEPPKGLTGKDMSASLEAEGTAFLTVPVSFSNLRWYGIDEYRGVRDERYTYVETRAGAWLLYDRVTDPYQLVNRVDDDSLREVREKLAQELLAWRALLSDEFLEGQAYVERDGLEHHFTVNEELGYSFGPDRQWVSTNARGKRWCVDTPIDLILENEEARGILHDALPRLVSDLTLSNGGRDSVRVVSMLHIGILSAEELSQLDARLLTLDARDESHYDRVSSDRIFVKATRRPAEYVA